QITALSRGVLTPEDQHAILACVEDAGRPESRRGRFAKRIQSRPGWLPTQTQDPDVVGASATAVCSAADASTEDDQASMVRIEHARLLRSGRRGEFAPQSILGSCDGRENTVRTEFRGARERRGG